MAINVGVLGATRKVKRIYVGVDGKARRVTRVRAKHPSLGSTTLARVCYNDKTRAMIKGSFSFGFTSPIVCRAIWSDENNAYLISGTFKDSALLSQISMSVDGTIADTGKAVSLSDASYEYKNPAPVAGDSLMLFSGAKDKKISVKKIDVDKMTESLVTSSDKSSFSFSAGYAVASNRQHGDPFDTSGTLSFPPSQFTAVNEYGNKFVATYSKSGGTGKSFVFSYRTKAWSSTPVYHDAVAKRMIVTDSSGGNIKILDLVGWFTSYSDGTRELSDIRTSSEYMLVEAANHSTEGVYIGAASNAAIVYNSVGTKVYDSYVCPVCYYNASKSSRICKLVIDSGRWGSTGDGGEVPVHDVQQYTEEFELTDSDVGRADNYIWKYLGWDYYGNQYVLSTVGDVVKVIKFSTGTDGITKVGEYDTGVALSDNVVLQDIVPNYFEFAGRAGRTDQQASPVFIITRNNEYNELFIVPPEIIV